MICLPDFVRTTEASGGVGIVKQEAGEGDTRMNQEPAEKRLLWMPRGREGKQLETLVLTHLGCEK